MIHLLIEATHGGSHPGYPAVRASHPLRPRGALLVVPLLDRVVAAALIWYLFHLSR